MRFLSRGVRSKQVGTTIGILDGFMSLARNINKVKGDATDETAEGVVSEPVSELSLDVEDKELIRLKNLWEAKWSQSEARKELERKQKENEKYWLGDHHTPAQKASGKRDLVDNLIFEAVETGIPFYTRQNAEPFVKSDETPEGQAIAQKVNDRLVDLADTIRLRLKVRKSTRHWALFYLGCIKLGWSVEHNEIAVQVVRPQTLILDPNGITDECEYDGEYAGQYRTEPASDLAARFPSKKDFITSKVAKKMGTKLRYIEWWTVDYLFWTMDDEVLGKSKNPHWNYESTDMQTSVDDYGIETANPITIPGVNHFSQRKIPLAFLSIFNLGSNPFDDTSLVEQALPQQDLINKRQRQIDKNADGMNGGVVVSGDSFTKDQAKQVSDALRRGAAVWVPRGGVANSYKRDQGVALPSFIYESLVDSRNELRNIFGTTGLSSQGIKGTENVRGKILVRQTDTDRASGIVDQLEQFYDYIYNWMVQLMYVYYDEPRNVNRAQGSTTIVNSELMKPLVVSVKEGSLIPKDRLTERNEAIDLWGAKAIDPIEFYKRLDFPNPYESAKALYLWQTNPISLFPDLQAQATEAAAAVAAGSGASPPGAPNEEEVAPAENLLNSVPIQ